jgi:protein TonB
VFPLTSRAMREHGTVWLLVQVSAGGDALQVSLQASSGYRRLDESALDAVRRWRFVPARRGDVTVPCAVLVPIVFNLPR